MDKETRQLIVTLVRSLAWVVAWGFWGLIASLFIVFGKWDTWSVTLINMMVMIAATFFMMQHADRVGKPEAIEENSDKEKEVASYQKPSSLVLAIVTLIVVVLALIRFFLQ